MSYNYDLYLSNCIDEYEKKNTGVCECCLCHQQLFYNDECYYIDNEYFCEECIERSKVTLDPEPPEYD